MAIDTTNEKLALIEYGDVFQPGIPISADGLDQADNQQLLWGYPGILWEESAEVEIRFGKSYIFTKDTIKPRSGIARKQSMADVTTQESKSGITEH